MKVSLKQLILLVALLSVIFTLLSSLTAGYRMNQNTLIENTLETNRVYAQKLATVTDDYLNMTLQTLRVSSVDLATYLHSEDVGNKLILEAERLKTQTNTFNSVVIVDADGEILATSPQTLQLKGKMLDSPGGLQALKERKPLVSKPYLSLTNRLIIFISHPIIDKDGNYLGLVGGSIYLKEENILKDLLGEHFYKNDSYVYVVDEDGRIIYHQTYERVNDLVPENFVVQKLMQGESGSAQINNTKNINMLAGYAHIPTSNWGVVSQRPSDVAIAPAKAMIKEMIIKSLPFLVLTLVVIWFTSKLIAQPLQKLAQFTESSTENNKDEDINNVRAWYYEAIQLKKSLAHSLTFLHDKVSFFTHQSTTDPLTKLMNRRTMDEQMKKWIESETTFSIIMLDIDRFKRVNDTYGHSFGDKVLLFLADHMLEVSRKDDVCCRFGGEEFIMLLPHSDNQIAYQVAERLREKMERTVSPCGDIVTISAGIATYPNNALTAHELIEKADQCLYEAKKTGRNKCIVSE